MKTLVAAKLALLPFLILMLAAGFGHGMAGAAVAMVLSLLGAWVYSQSGRDPVVFWITSCAALLLFAAKLAGSADPAHEIALVETALGVGMGIGILLGRPWTKAVSAAGAEGMSSTPLFHRINVFISALWSALFICLGWLAWIRTPPAARWAPVAAGILFSVLVPKLWVRRNLRKRLELLAGYSWAAPDFDAPTPGTDVDVAVVGAGMGGLTAAALLARAGLKVAVFERQAVPGGFSQNWRRRTASAPGSPVFRFEAGVHDISGAWEGGAVRGLFKHLGVADRLTWFPVNHQRWADGRVIDLPRDWAAYVDSLTNRFPAESEAISSALENLRAVYDAMLGDRGQTAGVPLLPATVGEMELFARRNPIALKWMERPFDEFLAFHKVGPEAAKALGSLSAYITGEPRSATVEQMAPLLCYYVHGGFFSEGGSLALAKALVSALTAAGGSLHLRTPVAKIEVADGAAAGVTLEDGRTIRARAVVCNADLIKAASSLVDRDLWPEDFRRKLDDTRPAASAFMVHLGVRGDLRQVQGSVFLRDGDFGVSITSPSHLDRSAATAGYSTLEITRLVDTEEATSWFSPENGDLEAIRKSEAYRERKKAAGDQLVAAAIRVVPDLAERIVFREEASPVTFGRFAGTTLGSIYGVEGPAKLMPVKSPLRGLAFAGSAIRGAGIEATMISGAWAAEALLPGRTLSAP